MRRVHPLDQGWSGVIGEVEAKRLLAAYRIGVPDERSAADVRRAFAEVNYAARGARFEGALVSRQVEPVAELLVGINSDPQFGHVVLVAMGGIFTESLRDVSLRMPPIDEQMAAEMLNELQGVAVLRGARGRPPADITALVNVLGSAGRHGARSR